MDLPNLFSHSTEMDARLLLCSVLTDTTIQSLLLKVTAQGTKVIRKSSVVVYSEENTAVMKMDETLQELGEESENINEILFALDPAWMSHGDLVADKKPILHKLVTDLALRPIGFVVQSEALVQHSINHNAHFSAIVLLLTMAKVTVTIVTQGKVVFTQSVGRSNDIVADLTEAFARYLKEKNEAHLPGKLLCASFALPEVELVTSQQKLLEATWPESVPFIQTPTIDVVKPDLAVTIIAEQVGEAVNAASATPLPEESNLKPVDDKKAEEFGFSQVPVSELKHEKKEELAVEVDREALPTSFGIPIKHEFMGGSEKTDSAEEELAVEVDHSRQKSKKSGGMLSGLFAGSPGAHGSHHNPKLFMVIGFVAGIVALLIVGYVWLFLLSTVTISVKAVTKTIAKEVSLTLDPDLTEPNADTLNIPAQKVTTSLVKETEGNTTGIKIVGDKAKGEALIYNKTDAQKSFPSGTVVSSGQLQFVTEAEVTVPASKENDSGTGKVYGEAKVAVTAYLIGVEGNITKDTELTVANFDKSSYTAKSLADFSGGTSREIRVVSKEDRELLLSEAKKAMLEDAQKEFKDKSVNGMYILPTEQLAITKATYSAELEAPTESLTLKLEGTVTALAYKTDDLFPLAEKVLADQVPQGYQLTDKPPEILSAPSQGTGTTKAVTLKANISAEARPKLDFNALQSEVAGMRVDGAKEHLESKKVMTDIEFMFTPAVAKNVVKNLPKQPDKITIEEKK